MWNQGCLLTPSSPATPSLSDGHFLEDSRSSFSSPTLPPAEGEDDVPGGGGHVGREGGPLHALGQGAGQLALEGGYLEYGLVRLLGALPHEGWPALEPPDQPHGLNEHHQLPHLHQLVDEDPEGPEVGLRTMAGLERLASPPPSTLAGSSNKSATLWKTNFFQINHFWE